MGLFGFRKKNKVIDLAEKYHRQQEKAVQGQNEVQEQGSQSGAFDFLGNMASSASTQTSSSGYIDVSRGDEKKKKLAKRLLDLTNKIEDLSNQIYHLQQRIEVLERKSGMSNSKDSP